MFNIDLLRCYSRLTYISGASESEILSTPLSRAKLLYDLLYLFRYEKMAIDVFDASLFIARLKMPHTRDLFLLGDERQEAELIFINALKKDIVYLLDREQNQYNPEELGY